VNPTTDKDSRVKDRPGADQKEAQQTRRAALVQGLEFVGRTEARGEVKVKLLYPVEGKRLPVIGRLARTPPPTVWKEKEITLDFRKAPEIAVPKEAAERKQYAKKEAESREPRNPQQPGQLNPLAPIRDDLEGLWAAAQVDQFLELDGEVVDFGYYCFAATATARKYSVPLNNDFAWRRSGFRSASFRDELFNRELYNMTTGSAAITESLQLRRMNNLGRRLDETKRTIPIARIQGIDVAEHPWEKMMGDRKPAPEPLARLVPHDNYYVTFRQVSRLAEFAALLTQWGGNLTRSFEMTSRDERVWERYEQQLCLRTADLARTLGPDIVKGVAITGSDAYLREGSDVAVLFQVVRKEAFQAAVEAGLAQARTRFGARLKESTTEHNAVGIRSLVTPLREVSLHTAGVDDVVIHANSLTGLHRILDACQGKSKRLADSLDFQYMRTIFRADDKDEDGFAFLSDAFIRGLVGPASKIKERRRLEALVSLHMLTHGAMLTAWETGKPPVSHPNLLQVAGLKKEELPMPEGSPAFWDPEKLIARSEAYNTVHFATPLIELPIDDVTQTEADEYNRFRLEYLGLWRQFFDPVGMRLTMRDGEVKLETYILPLIANTAYDNLRRVTGQKTVRFDPASIPGQTLFQYLMRLSSDMQDREGWFGLRGEAPGPQLMMMVAWAIDPVGEWFLVRINDSPVFEKLVRLAERADQGEEVDVEEVARLVWSIPIAVGVDIKNPLTVAGTLAGLRTAALTSLPGGLTWAPLEKEYKGVSIVRIQATPSGRRMLDPVIASGPRPGRKEPFLPALYYAMIDGGLYLTLNEEMMRQLIDGATGRKEGNGVVEAASSLYLAPGAAEQAQGLLRRLLEYQTHQQARTSLPIWYVLYRCGIVAEGATRERAREAAYSYLGYVPVSPDGAGYRYDRAHDEVVNERHGSFRKPTLHKTTADDAPVNFLLTQLRSLRADLRFREDGIHTVLTIQQGKKDR
jgi:hypothetical protein